MQPSPRARVCTGVTLGASNLGSSLAFGLALALAGGAAARGQSYPLRGPEGLQAVGVLVDAVEHRGEPAVRLRGVPGVEGHQIAIVRGAALGDGAITLRLAGQPAAGANDAARGFVGIAFHVGGEGERFECFYLRPTNGRADDQLRRNHSTQYIAHPGFPWHELRKLFPGVYESYVDLVPGEWTDVRVEVEGTTARLFVHGASQPALLVNDLKLGAGTGGIALWIGEGTEAWFRELTVTPR